MLELMHFLEELLDTSEFKEPVEKPVAKAEMQMAKHHINAGKIFIFDDDKLALFVFIPLYNLIPRHFVALGFRYALVIDWTLIGLSKEPELQFFTPGRRVQRDRNGYQTETNGAFPERFHIICKYIESGRPRRV